MRDMADRSTEEDSASIWTHIEKRNRSHEKKRGDKQERQTQGKKKQQNPRCTKTTSKSPRYDVSKWASQEWKIEIMALNDLLPKKREKKRTDSCAENT